LLRHTVLENQIQGLFDKDSMTLSLFKDFQGLEICKKKVKDFQGPATALFMSETILKGGLTS